jgi:DNA-binding Lrp family transcriptional regulator
MPRPPRDALDHRLLDRFQRDFPLEPRPYAHVARELGCTEDEVLARLAVLQDEGAVSRVGAVIAPQRAGWSTLAAMKVPPAHLDEVAALVSSYPEVNHNYEREHELNLWFVVAAPTRGRVGQVLSDIVYRTSLEVLDLPLDEAYRLDLGFALS